MRRFLQTILLLVSICYSGLSYGQSVNLNGTIKNSKFKALIDEVNYFLDKYASLNPWEIYTDTSGYMIPGKELEKMLEEADESGRVPVESLKNYFDGRILESMKAVLSNKQITEYKLEDILHLEVRVSDDKKMFSLFYEENTAGSAKTKISFLHYRRDDGKLINYYPTADSIPVVNPNGYDHIYAVNSGKDVKYLLLGGNVGCNTCYVSYIQLIKFVNGKPVKYFDYTSERRSVGFDENSIVYDRVKKAINISFVKDDLSPLCPCIPAYKNKNRKRCTCRYVYNGKTFML